MKKNILLFATAGAFLVLTSCQSGENNTEQKGTATADSSNTPTPDGQSGVQDNVSEKNIVQVAMGSKEHSTLVAAVKAAKLVDALSNAGPFTVFAPTNAAFDKLPAGTVEGLLKPEKLEALQDILQYHVSIGVYQTDALHDGQVLGQANSGNISISKKDGKIKINGTATIIGTVQASNGVIHIIDQVLLPPAK